jgi:hypothetical protein
MARRLKITESQIGEIIKRYQDGESANLLAKEYKLTGSTIIYHLERHNVAIRRHSEAMRMALKNRVGFMKLALINQLTCKRCGETKPKEQFSIKQFFSRVKRRLCNACKKERAREYQKAWEANNQRGKRFRERLRTEVLNAYGNVCACCGEGEPKFLSIDHINNDGAEHRRQLAHNKLYSWLKRQGFPKDRYQLLCMNCNFAKGLYGKCPHAVKRTKVANGYLDADTLDELGQSVSSALRSLKEAEQPSVVGASAHQVTLYEPRAS